MVSPTARAALRRLTYRVATVADAVAPGAQVDGRVKDVFSTWIKMKTTGRTLDEIHDLVGVRVLVDTVDQCYAVLSALLVRWRTLRQPEDYISRPKRNGYRSLHVLLEDEEGEIFEVQIRTHVMHEHNERGAASHREYKRRQLDESFATPVQPGFGRGAVLVALERLRRQISVAARAVHGSLDAVATVARSAVRGATSENATGPTSSPTTASRVLRQPVKEPTVVAVLSVIMVGVVGFLDLVSGYAVGFAIFYLLPVGAATWWVGGRFGATVAALSTGAWWLADHATAPIALPALVSAWNAAMRLGIFLIVNRTLNALRRALDAQLEMARIDHVSGAVNARGFFEATQRELERARRWRRPLTVAFVDLDDFKKVNDLLGHVAGDRLLRRWADAVRLQLRSTDMLARVGGDEFAILMPETPEQPAREMLERIRTELAAVGRANDWPFTFSLGAVTFVTPPESVDEVVGAADGLMYTAKLSGKDTSRFEVRGHQPSTAPESAEGSSPRNHG